MRCSGLPDKCNQAPKNSYEEERERRWRGRTRASPASPGQGQEALGGGRAYDLCGAGEETGGTYSLTDSTVLPQGEAPPQIHHREDESFYVLEGEFEFLDRDQWIKAAPGSFVRVPKGSLHTLKNSGEEVGRL